ncbi:MAG: patatin-like phospholipase family protein [Candidatus Marinimicrobia bacterium]|nr:patatin-like phospholipase family protein [Candidatus Neomarinimicrobiota bacterium]
MNPKQIYHRSRRRHCGIALGGGGALGLAHVGVLKALEEYGIFPRVISGNSAGALIGGLYVSGIPVEGLIDLSQQLGDDLFDYLKMSFRGGLMNGKRIYRLLLDILGEKRIEDCDIPFLAATVDLDSGKTYYIHRGRIADAIRASISVPGVFPPFEANGLRLIDGGVRDAVPLRALNPYPLSLRIGVGILKASLNNNTPGYLDISPGDERDETAGNESPRILKVISRSMAISATEATFKGINISKPDLAIYVDLGDTMKIWEFKRHEIAIGMGYEQASEQLKAFFG